MKATLKFNLEKEKEAFFSAIHGMDYKVTIDDFDEWIFFYEHLEDDDNAKVLLSLIREKWRELNS